MPPRGSRATVAAILASIDRFGGHVMKVEKCPVCDWEIKDGGIKVQVGGKVITVCCADCAKTVEEDPAKYVGAAG
jgi:hypothetical protein